MWSSVLSLIFLLAPLTVTTGVPSNTFDSLAPTQRDEWNLKRRFHIYDNCSIPSSSLTHLVDVLRKVDKNKTDCAATPYLGVIGPMNPRIQVGMERFLKISKITYFPPEQTSLRDEIKVC
ncbi:hypothetical protein AVEN_119128-1 [Araneus ventricosus]|uniref:Receptor ligand binding region domain-containing protein n=1 Tax=Araneus ventricosus TaxID=182803 RepID=A0A4Y2BLC3_ARAVE|nr:hypothetical protein AVEN_119128-1 [Araneus ventricosus]